MGSGIFYSKKVNCKKNVKGNRFLRSFLFAGILLLGTSFVSKAVNTAPVFQYGTAYPLTVCQDAGAVDINSILTIIDPDFGDGETWSVVTPPTHGTLSQSASFNV